MTAPRKLQRFRLLPLCLLLVSAGALAEARDVRMQGPNSGGGECVEAEVDSVEVAGTDAEGTATPATKPAAATTRIKPVIPVRGGDAGSGGSHSPRWHSFLPGMFR